MLWEIAECWLLAGVSRSGGLISAMRACGKIDSCCGDAHRGAGERAHGWYTEVMTRNATSHTTATPRRADAGMIRTLLGYACNQAFMFALFYMGWNSALELGGVTFERVDLLITLLACAATLVIMRAVTRHVRDVLLNRSFIWCYAVLLAIGSSVSLPAEYGLASMLVEGLLVGVPFACMLAAWGRALAVRSHGEGARGVLLATAVAAVWAFLLAVACAYSSLLLAVANLLPFASAWALGGVAPLCEEGEAAREATSHAAVSDVAHSAQGLLSFGNLLASKQQRIETARISRKVLGGAVVFGVAGGLMETYASDPGMMSTPTFPATLLLLALFCAGSLQVVGAPTRQGESDGQVSSLLVGVYRLALLLMMAGYLFMPVLEPYGVPGDAIVLAGYLGLTAVLVSLFILTAKLTGMDAALSFSRGFAALYLGEALGLALGNALEVSSPSGEMPFAVASCAGLATMFAYLFLFTEGDFVKLSRIAKQADRFEDTCHALAVRFKLSKRESEILPLALRGRTGERIAAELFIAKSTVDTHIRRIYGKCGVHSRQELIDLGEQQTQDLVSGKESSHD